MVLVCGGAITGPPAMKAKHLCPIKWSAHGPGDCLCVLGASLVSLETRGELMLGPGAYHYDCSGGFRLINGDLI